MSTFALPMQELKPALTGLGKIMSRHSTLPVLNHIKIERTPDGWVALTATDLDAFATVRLEQPAEGEPTTVLVPFDELQKVVRNCSRNDTVSIQTREKLSESSGPEVMISYPVGQQRIETRVPTLPVEEFPPTPRANGDSIPIPETLRSSLQDAFECSSIDETRLILNGAYIDVSDTKGHYVIGTDGRHLFASNSFSLPLKSCVILPSHRFLTWKGFNQDGEWKLKIEEAPGKDTSPHVQLTSRRWRFITRQHDGTFPNWRQVIPSNDQYNTGITFDPETLDTVIKTAERMPDHDDANHTVLLELKHKTVNLCCKANRESPWTPVELNYVKAEGKDVRIALNRHLLIKALRFGLNRLETIDPLSPMRFSNGGRQMIVMPLRADVANPEPEPENDEDSEKPAESPTTEPERSTNVPRTPPTSPAPASNGNGNGSHPAEKPALERALDQIEGVKGSYREAIKGLNELTDTLKQVARDQKDHAREVASVRSTLERLQSVKL